MEEVIVMNAVCVLKGSIFLSFNQLIPIYAQKMIRLSEHFFILPKEMSRFFHNAALLCQMI